MKGIITTRGERVPAGDIFFKIKIPNKLIKLPISSSNLTFSKTKFSFFIPNSFAQTRAKEATRETLPIKPEMAGIKSLKVSLILDIN